MVIAREPYSSPPLLPGDWVWRSAVPPCERGAECLESRKGNTGDLLGSGVHIPSQMGYKRVMRNSHRSPLKTRQRTELKELIMPLNRIIAGWRGYFSVGDSAKKLADLDRYMLRKFEALHAVRRMLSVSRMRENLTYGLMRRGVEARTKFKAPRLDPTSRSGLLKYAETSMVKFRNFGLDSEIRLLNSVLLGPKNYFGYSKYGQKN